MFLFPQNDDICGGLPQGIGFGERKIYILAKGYFFAKLADKEVEKKWDYMRALKM